MARLLRSIALAGLFAAALTSVDGRAQQQQQPQPPPPPPPPAGAQTPIFRAGVNYVRVDVIVSDRAGNPVMNLTPDDFQIVEQNVVQKIDAFKLIALDGGLIPGPNGPPREIRTELDEELEAAREDVRLFGIFLDDYHVRRETSMMARGQIARFVETQLGPSDMIGLMHPLDPTASVKMTRNHEAIVGGINQFMGRKYDYTPRNELEERYAYYPTTTVEQIRNQISMSAIKAFILHLGGLKEGRKALILVSEGYTALLPPQLREQMAAIPGVGNTAAAVPANDINEQRAQWSASVDMEDELREIFTLANRNNVAIYAVDPRGLAAAEFSIEQNVTLGQDSAYLSSSLQTLRTLAVETDGRAIINRNDLTMGMKQIVRDSSAYYLLGYNSTFTNTDGKFHEIKVTVKKPGMQVRARKGYYAFTAQDAARVLAPPKPEVPQAYSSALNAIAAPSRSRVIRSWVGTARGADGKTRVTFLWEPVAATPGERSRPGDKPVRVAVTAVSPSGAPYYRGRVPENPAATAPSSLISFEAPPGPVQLRLSVENAEAEVLDSEVRELVVPDLTGPDTALATPELFRARTQRDYQQLKADPKGTPTAAREFTRTDRIFIRVTAYGPGQAPALTAKLLNRSGQPISDLATSPSAAANARDVDVALTVLPPGEYLVEISAAGADHPVTSVVGFRITS